MPDASGPLWAFRKLGSQLMIYTKNSVHLMTYMGDPMLTFTIRKVLHDAALLGPACVCSLWDKAHAWSTRSGFVVWDGSSAPLNIGKKIQSQYYTDLSTAKQNEAITFFDPIRNRIYFGVPVSGSKTKFYVYEFTSLGNILNGFWTIFEASSGFGQVYAGITESQNGRTMFSVKSGKSLAFRDGEGIEQDNFGGNGATNIDWEWQSKDFISPRDVKSLTTRWSEVELEVKGSSSSSEIDIFYSINEGGAWVKIYGSGDPTLSGIWQRLRVPIDVSATNIRVKVVGVVKKASIQWCRVWFQGSGRTGVAS